MQKNNIYVNLIGGDISASSLNYERFFLIRPKFFLAGSLGIGFNKDNDSEGTVFELSRATLMTVPHHVTMNVGKKKSYFEFGIGGTWLIGEANQHYYVYPIIGYRFHPFKSLINNYRVYIGVPFYGWENADFWMFPIGLSVGAGF
jgi:hypothetical protein